MSTSSDDYSSDDETLSYLIATGMLPGASAISQAGKHVGSAVGRRENTARDFEAALQRLHHDYFSETPRYSEKDFERRFRIPRSVFNRIKGAIVGEGIFVHRNSQFWRKRIHPILRIAATLRILAYGVAADALDEYLQMSEDSVLLYVKAFCKAIVEKFGTEYLRELSEEDLRRIMRINAAIGFPGCVGSIDCQHWEWKNCPIAWTGQFKGKKNKPTVVLEAISDGELWIWHAFFGCSGSLNDINIQDRSPTIGKIIAGEFPPSIPYTVNGTVRRKLYYFADGLYLDWAIFVKAIKDALSQKEKRFASQQEAVRKDVERAFGVLLARFHILQRPARLWFQEDIANVMKACIIIHNMVVEAPREHYSSQMSSLQFVEEARQMFGSERDFVWESESAFFAARGGISLPRGMWAGIVNARENHITSSTDHNYLKLDLISYIWERCGCA